MSPESDSSSEVGAMENEQCNVLARRIYEKTNGNALHTTQQLKRFQTKDEWSISLECIYNNSSSSSDSMLDLFSTKIKEQPVQVQEVLMVASCLGSAFDESLLCHSGVVTSSIVLQALSVADELGLIEFDFGAGLGRFAHDKFQEAALALIPEGETDLFRLRIGRSLLGQLPESDLRKHFHLVVNLMVQGSNRIEHTEEREKLAMLCTTAARKFAKTSAFHAAIHYVESGIKSFWRNGIGEINIDSVYSCFPQELNLGIALATMRWWMS